MACFRKELSLFALALCFSVVTSCGYPPWAWEPFKSSTQPYQQVCKCLDHPANEPGPPFQLSHIPGSVVFYGQRDYDDYITCQATLPAHKHCPWKIIKVFISLPIECGEPPNCDQEDHFTFSSDQREKKVCGTSWPLPPCNASKNTSLNAIFQSNRIRSSTQMESIWIGYCEPQAPHRECRPSSPANSTNIFSSCPIICRTSPQLCRYLCSQKHVEDDNLQILIAIVVDNSGAAARAYENSKICLLRDAARLALENIARYGMPVPILNLRKTGQGKSCTVHQNVSRPDC